MINQILQFFGLIPELAFAGFDDCVVSRDEKPTNALFKGGASAPAVKTPKMPKAPKMPAPNAPDVSGIELLLRQQNRVTNRMNAQMQRANANQADTNAQMQQSLLAAMPKERELPTLEPTPPPPTTSMKEVQDARDQTKRDAAKRRGMRKTVVAGETGGYQKSLLG